MRRNEGKHTDKETMKKRILLYLETFKWGTTSMLGYVAFKGYDFKSPQAAALAVSKVVKEMREAGDIIWKDRVYWLPRSHPLPDIPK